MLEYTLGTNPDRFGLCIMGCRIPLYLTFCAYSFPPNVSCIPAYPFALCQKVCAVKAPGFGDNRKATLQDIAVLTGGQVVSQEVGLKLEDVTAEQCGTCKLVSMLYPTPDDSKTELTLYARSTKACLNDTSCFCYPCKKRSTAFKY